MRKLVAVTIIALTLCGCYCRRCQGQGAPKDGGAATVILTSTEVNVWKQTIYDGLNKLGANPYEAICNLLLTNAYGFEKVPVGKETAAITQGNADKMNKLSQSIKAALGFRIIEQASVLSENREAVSAAIESATDTIKDEKQRHEFLLKAKLLTGE
jgi:hypothetical protein